MLTTIGRPITSEPSGISPFRSTQLVIGGCPLKGEAMITITQHEKSEWSRMAQGAYSHGLNFYGHRYSVMASLPAGHRMTASVYDTLQGVYREWLLNGWKDLRG